jgi:hypothetical protein
VRFPTRRRSGQRLATYAAILDGRHLWLTLEDGGSATLSGHGQSHPLSEVTDLLALLPGTEPLTLEIVADGRPVWAAPPPEDPVRTPVSPDGRTQLALERTEEGHLRVSRRPAEPTAVLERIEMRGQDVHLTLRPPDGVRVGDHLLLLDTDDEVIATLPVTAHEGHVEALIGVPDLPAGYFGILRIALGAESDWAKVRRRRSDLTDPHRAVLLPELHDPDGDEDHPRARFRWNPESLLVVRVLDPNAPDVARATVTSIAPGSGPS